MEVVGWFQPPRIQGFRAVKLPSLARIYLLLFNSEGLDAKLSDILGLGASPAFHVKEMF